MPPLRRRPREERPRPPARDLLPPTGVAKLTPKAPRRRAGGQGVPPGDGTVRDRRHRRHDGREGHGPRHDRQRLPVGLAAPAARARLARALQDERDAPAQRALRRQRAVPRPAALRRALRRAEAPRRSSPRSRGTNGLPLLDGALAHLVCRVVDVAPGGRSRAVDRRGRVPRPPRRRAAAVLHGPVRHDARGPGPQRARLSRLARSTPGTARRGARPGPPRGTAGARSASGRAEHEQARLGLVCQFDQRRDRARARDPQQLGRDAERRGPRRGRADRVEILLVRQRRVLAARASPSADTAGAVQHVREDQLGARLERAVDRHALGARVDPHRQRPEQHRARAAARPSRVARRPPAIEQLRHRQRVYAAGPQDPVMFAPERADSG